MPEPICAADLLRNDIIDDAVNDLLYEVVQLAFDDSTETVTATVWPNYNPTAEHKLTFNYDAPLMVY